MSSGIGVEPSEVEFELVRLPGRRGRRRVDSGGAASAKGNWLHTS